jgi:hypothetical protein
MVADYPQWVQALSGSWGQAKLFVETGLGLDNDLFHVIAGPLIQLLAALVLRRSPQHLAPWLTVLALELLNEWHDLIVETWPIRSMQYGEGLKDILLTMMFPTLIIVMTRAYPHWFRMSPLRKRRRRGSGLR